MYNESIDKSIGKFSHYPHHSEVNMMAECVSDRISGFMKVAIANRGFEENIMSKLQEYFNQV